MWSFHRFGAIKSAVPLLGLGWPLWTNASTLTVALGPSPSSPAPVSSIYSSSLTLFTNHPRTGSDTVTYCFSAYSCLSPLNPLNSCVLTSLDSLLWVCITISLLSPCHPYSLLLLLVGILWTCISEQIRSYYCHLYNPLFSAPPRIIYSNLS